MHRPRSRLAPLFVFMAIYHFIAPEEQRVVCQRLPFSELVKMNGHRKLDIRFFQLAGLGFAKGVRPTFPDPIHRKFDLASREQIEAK